jgi:outer membrane protein assembly factor BamD (BamD/ComL family)
VDIGMNRAKSKAAALGGRALLVAALAALPSVMGGLLQPYSALQLTGVAAAQEGGGDERKTTRTQAMSQPVYEKLNEGQKLIEEKKYREAINQLNSLFGGRTKLNSYEVANVHNLLAFAYYSQEDYNRALESYRKVIAQPDIPEALVTSTKYTIAQLYFVQEQWQQGINMLQDWVKTQKNPSADVYVLFGQGYYSLKQYDRALQNIEKAVSMTKAQGKKPKEQWLALLRYLYYEKNQPTKAVAVLEELIALYPKKEYWLQLSQMYGEAKQEKKQLAALDAVYVAGGLDKEQELVTLAYLWLQQEVPYKAAKIIDKGIKEKKVQPTAKNMELLGNAWRMAQETKAAIPVMEEAARKSDKGELWATLGNVYLDNEENQKAVNAAKAAIAKGGLRRPDNAYLVMGMAHFNLKQFDAARTAFNQAAKDKRSATYARQWLEFIDKELERQESLRKG